MVTRDPYGILTGSNRKNTDTNVYRCDECKKHFTGYNKFSRHLEKVHDIYDSEPLNDD
jgi:uncharacterized C2H2 Zn-finger protein